MKVKIKKSSIISLAIAFSMVFATFTPIVSYAAEMKDKDVVLDGEKPSEGQTPEGEQPSEGQTPEGEQPSEGQTPEGEQPSEGQTPEGEQPSEGQTPEGEQSSEGQTPEGEQPSEGQTPEGQQPLEEQTPEEELVVEEMNLKQNIEKILDMTLSQITKIVYNFWEDEESVKTDEQSEINEVLTSKDGNISLWDDKNSKVKNSCLLKETDGSNRPYFDIRFDNITKTLTFDYVIEGLIGASRKDGKYVIEGEDGDQTAFCYNNNLKAPTSDSKSPYLPAEDFNGQENKNEDAIKSILYAGSEFDGFGYKQQFNLGGKEHEFMTHSATQDAIWIMLGQRNEQERLKLYQTNINSYDRYIANAKTEEEKAKYQKQKEILINTKAYLEALLDAGRKELKPNDTGKPSLSNSSTDIKFDKNQDGTYETEAVALVGYSGVVKLKLPDGVTAYDENGNVIGTGEVEISTQKKFKLKSINKPDVKANISAVSYDYIFPKAIQYFKAVFDLGGKDHSSLLPASKQNLLSYTIDQKNGEEVNFSIGVPTDGEPDVNPPVPPSGGGDSNGHKPSPPTDDTVINPPVPPADDTVINPPVPPTDDNVINPPVPPTDDTVVNPPVPPTDDTVINPPVPPTDDTVVKSPKTGDETQIMSYLFIGIIAICGLGYHCKRVKN
ncbi:thioester domain-containing protein [Clostridioides sp. ES-S-0056-01]|uniref:Cys-Gln thioester bond-forming surface protein n=1 Tax=Clostridioides sp. ES-S-0056-01 TaxID=2770781 RepID=UPI001D0F84FD|nr:cell surface protein [Clostridioides sp. ES-S-0056-01]